jgi:hypothetical protein
MSQVENEPTLHHGSMGLVSNWRKYRNGYKNPTGNNQPVLCGLQGESLVLLNQARDGTSWAILANPRLIQPDQIEKRKRAITFRIARLYRSWRAIYCTVKLHTLLEPVEA